MTTIDGFQSGSLTRLRRLPRESGIGSVLALVFVGFVIVSPNFRTAANLRAVVLGISLYLVLSIGQTLVVLTRNLDLTVGSVTGLSAMVVGSICSHTPGISWIVVLGAGLGVGACVGLVNGLVISRLGISSIIFTLGMLSVIRGLVFAVGGDTTITSSQLPSAVTGLTGTLLGVPELTWIALALAVIAGFALAATPTGRSIYAVGSNPVAARLQGLSVQRITVLVFVLSGMLAGLSGILFLGQFGFADFSAATGYELTTVAIVVIGGASIFGGEGTILGTVLGCLLVGVATNGLAVIGLSGYWQDVLTGALIVSAVSIDAYLRRRAAGTSG